MKRGTTEKGYDWSGPDFSGEIEVERPHLEYWVSVYLTRKDLEDMLKAFNRGDSK